MKQNVWKMCVLEWLGPLGVKFHVEGVDPRQPLLVRRKGNKGAFVWYRNFRGKRFPFRTIPVCDRRMDGRTDRQTVKTS